MASSLAVVPQATGVTRVGKLSSVSINSHYASSTMYLAGDRASYLPSNGMLALPSAFHPATLLDLELLHHFTTTVSFSISNEPPKQRIWQEVVPREALRYDFLMHAILAIAAVSLICRHIDHSHVYQSAARTHQQLALTSSLPCFRNITPMNCHALFALSNIIALLAFVFPHAPTAGRPANMLDDISNFFTLIRGVDTTLKSAFEWIAQGPLAELFRRDWHAPKASLPHDVATALECLSAKNAEIFEDTEHQHFYASAIQELRVAFQRYKTFRDEPGMVFVWPVIVQEAYIAAVAMKEPLALAILAHYAVLLHRIDGPWWLQGRGKQLIDTVRGLLTPEWLSMISWPLSAVDISLQDIIKPSSPDLSA